MLIASKNVFSVSDCKKSLEKIALKFPNQMPKIEIKYFENKCIKALKSRISLSFSLSYFCCIRYFNLITAITINFMFRFMLDRLKSNSKSNLTKFMIYVPKKTSKDSEILKVQDKRLMTEENNFAVNFTTITELESKDNEI